MLIVGKIPFMLSISMLNVVMLSVGAHPRDVFIVKNFEVVIQCVP
jgi:hypothetical protein